MRRGRGSCRSTRCHCRAARDGAELRLLDANLMSGWQKRGCAKRAMVRGVGAVGVLALVAAAVTTAATGAGCHSPKAAQEVSPTTDVHEMLTPKESAYVGDIARDARRLQNDIRIVSTLLGTSRVGGSPPKDVAAAIADIRTIEGRWLGVGAPSARTTAVNVSWLAALRAYAAGTDVLARALAAGDEQLLLKAVALIDAGTSETARMAETVRALGQGEP